jgi:hypothetical protein
VKYIMNDIGKSNILFKPKVGDIFWRVWNLKKHDDDVEKENEQQSYQFGEVI